MFDKAGIKKMPDWRLLSTSRLAGSLDKQHA